jgi:triacylglycerol esterase/lipase EstA (alpha/beta hydrolase family)
VCPSIFDTPETPVATTITIDYGTEYPRKYGYEPLSLSKKAVLFGSLPSGWKWGAKNPLHFIAHSQGGNTMRLLIELMNGKHKSLHPEYFHEEDRQSWIKSLVTLGTPHKGTTITDVVQVWLTHLRLDN